MGVKSVIQTWLGIKAGGGAGGFGMGGMWPLVGRTETREFLQAFEEVGWLNAPVMKIAASVADAKWRLYRGDDKHKRTEIISHPVLDLINYVNPFDTVEEHMELHQIFMELAGKCFWVLNRNKLGIPAEIWIFPSHQMRVIPSQTDFIAGFEYTSGQFRKTFRPEEVIFFKYPRPLNRWDGLSPFKTVAVDIDAEEFAGKWNRAFFKNSARVDSVIEVDGTLGEDNRDSLKKQWQENYGGVDRAHKTAILEGGAHYKPTSMTQKDMDFVNLRKYSRENLLGVVGMPLPMMGITENVNRANAEAGAYIFARWIIKPRLDRIRNKLNQKLLPQFPNSQGLFLDYDEIVQETMEQKKGIAETGVKWGMLTINEGRQLLGLDAIEGGDKRLVPMNMLEIGVGESQPPPTPKPEEEALKSWADERGQPFWEMYALKAEKQETIMISALVNLWKDQEAEVLGKLPGANKPDDVIFNMEKAKARFKKKLKPIMTEILREAMEDADALIHPEPEHRVAEEEYPLSKPALKWLEERSSWMVTEVNTETRNLIAGQLAEGFEAGEGIPDLSRRIRGVFDTNATVRSKMIARTEVIASSNEGALLGYDATGVVKEVEFYAALDERTCEECMGLHGNHYALGNAGGVIPVHPNCRCTWLPIV